MAKVLITVLGKGPKKDDRDYIPAKYYFHEEEKVYETSLFATALSQYLQVDKIFMIGTVKSMWEEAYRYFSRADGNPEKENIWLDLARKIGEQDEPSILVDDDLTVINQAIDEYLQTSHANASGGSICKLIQYGRNHEEIMENFKIFMDFQKEIQPGDEIYLDITHGFRSIPLFMYLMIDLIQTLRKEDSIQVSGIYYGMLDAIDPIHGYAPVVDLKPFFELTQWTKGIYEFTNYGNVDLLVELLDDVDLKETLKNISDLANLNFIKELRSQVDRLRGLLNKTQTAQPIMFDHVKPKIVNFVEFFKGIDSDAKFQFRLAEWFYQHGRYANCLICLTESMVTQIAYIYIKSGEKINYKFYTDRKTLEKELLEKVMLTDNDRDFQDAGKLFSYIKDIRNNAAHAGFLDNIDNQKIISELGRNIKEIYHLYFSPEMEKKLRLLPKKYPFDTLISKKVKV